MVYILQMKSVMKLHFWQSRGKNDGLTLLILSFFKASGGFIFIMAKLPWQSKAIESPQDWMMH